ncbi:lysophospholipid acyltransferase family protein [Phenylobacterium immobile]|uniref:lysophospholipid acyltransferase family protein n=1 Tax=Phenylobacterium immobile TaxID=21 RepID=UPI000AD18004|nr:lysophospholipid acyltransferase family protein [Phenylobacterium immobile]
MLALRSTLFAIVFYSWTALYSLGMTPLLICPRGWCVVAMRFWSRTVIVLLRVICGIRVEVRGAPPQGPALIAAKHQSALDVYAEFAWLPDSCFVAKKELRKIPGFGWWALKARMIYVDREGGSGALKKLVRDAQDRLKDSRQVLIFPEGTRRPLGAEPDYKPGVAALYRELGMPVSPLATNSGAHWPRKGFRMTPGTIVFEYLEPIPPGLKRGEFMRLLEERIEDASARLARL